jgi:uroporphyrinogen-III synthase
MGFCALRAPALVIRALPARLPPPGRVQAVLVTSANALPAFSASWHGRPLFAVGSATAARARAAGFCQVCDAAGDAADLAALVARRLRPADGGLLLASGHGQGLALAADLRAEGFSVLRRVVYEACPAPALPDDVRVALLGGRIARALFFSAATARAFVRLARRAGLVKSLGRIEAITIGQPARMALEAVPWRSIRVADHPTQDAMLACLTK